MRFPSIAVVVALASLTSLLGTGCTRSDPDGDLSVMHAMLKDDVKTLDPANAYDSVSLEVAASVFETLYQYDYLSDIYRPIPLLAADMPKVSDDKLTVTVPIRHGIKFQDDPCFDGGKGREVKAADFIYGIKRLTNPHIQSQGFWIFDGKLVGYNALAEKVKGVSADKIQEALVKEAITGLTAPDDYTLQFKLTKPFPQLLYVLIMNFTSPVPREAIDRYGDNLGNWNDHPVGTGPFKLSSWDRTHRVVLDRNPTFHDEFYPTAGSADYRARGFLADAGKKLPLIDRVNFDILKEEQPRWLNFMKGNNDAVVVPKDNLAQVVREKTSISPELAAKGVSLDIDSGVGFYYIGQNMKDPILGKNKLLRQAISSAINRDKWVGTFTENTGVVQANSIPPGLQDRPKTAKIKYDYDLARAKDLLKKAGYPDGKGLPEIRLEMRGAATRDRQQGDMLAQQLAEAGIKLNVVYNTFPAFLEKSKQGNLQLEHGGWNLDYPDVENVYQLFYGPNKSPGPSEVNYENPVFDKLYERIAVMESGPARAALVQQMEDIVQEDVPWAMGYYDTEYKVVQPWLKNYRGSNMVLTRYKYLRIDKAKKKEVLGAKP
jgi:ABC-type transport system substrate-binding protein